MEKINREGSFIKKRVPNWVLGGNLGNPEKFGNGKIGGKLKKARKIGENTRKNFKTREKPFGAHFFGKKPA